MRLFLLFWENPKCTGCDERNLADNTNGYVLSGSITPLDFLYPLDRLMGVTRGHNTAGSNPAVTGCETSKASEINIRWFFVVRTLLL